MTAAGWINLVLSIGTVTVLFGWCIWKVLTHNRPEHNPVDDAFERHDRGDGSSGGANKP